MYRLLRILYLKTHANVFTVQKHDQKCPGMWLKSTIQMHKWKSNPLFEYIVYIASAINRRLALKTKLYPPSSSWSKSGAGMSRFFQDTHYFSKDTTTTGPPSDAYLRTRLQKWCGLEQDFKAVPEVSSRASALGSVGTE